MPSSTWSMVTHGQYVPGVNGGTSGHFDLTGVDLIVIQATWNNNGSFINIQDSLGNTYSQATRHNTGAFTVASGIYYCFAPLVSAAMTFTITGSGSAPQILFAGFGGGSSPLDEANGTQSTASITSISAGQSRNPLNNNSLLVCGIGMNATGALSIDTGFTIVESVGAVTSNHYSAGLAYLIQSVAANPTVTYSWSGNLSNEASINIAAFKPGTGNSYSASMTETDTASETVSSGSTATSSVTESVSASDATDAIGSFLASDIESASASDVTSSTGGNLVAVVAEALGAAEISSGLLSITEVMTETSGATSDVFNIPVSFAAIVEVFAPAIDAVASVGSFHEAVAEAGPASDAPGGGSLVPVGIVETVTASASVGGLLGSDSLAINVRGRIYNYGPFVRGEMSGADVNLYASIP